MIVSSPGPNTPEPAARGAWILSVGILALSSAALLIRWSEAGAIVTAFYRVFFSAVLLGVWAWSRGGRPDVRALGPTVLAGLALAAHFAAWMRSLELTSVASSLLFVTTTPVWTALASRWVPGEPAASARTFVGVGVSLLGGAWIALQAGTDGGVDPVGIGWATFGAWMMATYLFAARRARVHLDTVELSAGANAVAAIALGAVVALWGLPLVGFSPQTWAALAGLALVPQLLGHNSLLWALRRYGASVVAVVVLTEPIGGALLAWLFLGEAPRGFEVGGGLLLLLGLAIVLRSRAGAPPASGVSPAPRTP